MLVGAELQLARFSSVCQWMKTDGLDDSANVALPNHHNCLKPLPPAATQTQRQKDVPQEKENSMLLLFKVRRRRNYREQDKECELNKNSPAPFPLCKSKCDGYLNCHLSGQKSRQTISESVPEKTHRESKRCLLSLTLDRYLLNQHPEGRGHRAKHHNDGQS